MCSVSTPHSHTHGPKVSQVGATAYASNYAGLVRPRRVPPLLGLLIRLLLLVFAASVAVGPGGALAVAATSAPTPTPTGRPASVSPSPEEPSSPPSDEVGAGSTAPLEDWQVNLIIGLAGALLGAIAGPNLQR